MTSSYEIDNSILIGAHSALYNAAQYECSLAVLYSLRLVRSGGSSSSGQAIPTNSAEYYRIIALLIGAMTMVIPVAL